MSKWFKVVPCDLVGAPVGLGVPTPLYVQPNGGIPTLQQDLIGNINSGYPNKARGFVFGLAPLVNNVRIDLWEGPTTTYVFPDVPQQMQLVSTSANDTGAGTGVQRVHIHYLDTNYVVQNEQITLNGLTPVLTVATNILRINGLHSIRDGVLGGAAGNVSLTNLAGTVTYGYIALGSNTARQGIYTVPSGKTGYISHWQASSGSTGNHFCRIQLRATAHDGSLWPGVFLLQDEAGSENNGNGFTLPTPIPIPATADVKLSAISDAVNANVTAMGAISGWFE